MNFVASGTAVRLREDDVEAELPVPGAVPEPVAAAVPKPKKLGFTSLTVISSPDHNNVTLKLSVDGEARVFESHAGVGPVDAICGALHEVVPDFEVSRCGTDSRCKGSDAEAFAHVELDWGDMTFTGVGTHRNTLDATALAVIDGLNKLRPLQSFAGGRNPVMENGLWAGFLIDETGGTRGKGAREIALFRVAFDDYGKPVVKYVGTPTPPVKRRISKGYHSEKSLVVVKTRTDRGDTCHLFVESAIARSKKSCTAH